MTSEVATEGATAGTTAGAGAAASATAGAAASATAPGFWARRKRRPDPLTSVALTLPVFVVYHLGVVFVDRRSGVDLVSALVLSLLRASVPAYVIATLALALALASGVWIQQKRGALARTPSAPVFLESAGFAVLLLVTVGFATHRWVFRLGSPALSALGSLGVLDKLVLAAGSGFHEELLFRALMVSGGAWLIERLWRLSRGASFAIAVTVSSLGFALANNFGVLGEPFAFTTLAYYVLLGGLFAALYLVRGFAVAVYTHAFYTALVFFVYG